MRTGLALLAAALLAGCSTTRTLTIDSDPPAARVWVDGEERGTAPVDVPFVYYGRFEVRLEKEGYEPLATEVLVPAGIDGYPIVDLPFELVVRERRFVWRGTLEPISRRPSEADLRTFLDEARAFRARARAEARPERVGREAAGSPPGP